MGASYLHKIGSSIGFAIMWDKRDMNLIGLDNIMFIMHIGQDTVYHANLIIFDIYEILLN